MAEGLFKRDMTLTEMNHVLERALSADWPGVRIIADLPVSKEDYYILKEGLAPVKSNLPLLQHYRVSMVTAWVFAQHYEDAKKVDCRYMVEKWARIPQYSSRQFVNICNSVFVDYGAGLYFSEIHTEQELDRMVAAHAGIPERTPGRFRIRMGDLAV